MFQVQFQFLIGTIQTSYRFSNCMFKIMFQFLIGTIQTEQYAKKREEKGAVSIPYRYDPNDRNWFQVIPNVKFQFLIGTIQTFTLRAFARISDKGFNSL